MLAGEFDAALLSRGYLVDVADPAGYLLSDWACEGGYNIAHYCDPEADQHDRGGGGHRGQRRPERRSTPRSPRSCRARPPASSSSTSRWSRPASSDVQGFQPHPLDYYVLTADLTVG